MKKEFQSTSENLESGLELMFNLLWWFYHDSALKEEPESGALEFINICKNIRDVHDECSAVIKKHAPTLSLQSTKPIRIEGFNATSFHELAVQVLDRFIVEAESEILKNNFVSITASAEFAEDKRIDFELSRGFVSQIVVVLHKIFKLFSFQFLIQQIREERDIFLGNSKKQTKECSNEDLIYEFTVGSDLTRIHEEDDLSYSEKFQLLTGNKKLKQHQKAYQQSESSENSKSRMNEEVLSDPINESDIGPKMPRIRYAEAMRIDTVTLKKRIEEREIRKHPSSTKRSIILSISECANYIGVTSSLMKAKLNDSFVAHCLKRNKNSNRK